MTETTEELRDIQGFHAIHVPDWLWISLVVLVFLAAAWFIYKKFFDKDQDEELSLIEKTNKQLQNLSINMGSKAFYLEYSEIVRFYLEESLAMPVLERTAEEIKPLLISEHRIQTSHAAFLTKIFTRADLAKFAKYEISSELKAKDVETTIKILETIEGALIAEEERKREDELRGLDQVS